MRTALRTYRTVGSGVVSGISPRSPCRTGRAWARPSNALQATGPASLAMLTGRVDLAVRTFSVLGSAGSVASRMARRQAAHAVLPVRRPARPPSCRAAARLPLVRSGRGVPVVRALSGSGAQPPRRPDDRSRQPGRSPSAGGAPDVWGYARTRLRRRARAGSLAGRLTGAGIHIATSSAVGPTHGRAGVPPAQTRTDGGVAGPGRVRRAVAARARSRRRGSGRHWNTCWRGGRRGTTGEKRIVSRPTVAAARPAVMSAGDRARGTPHSGLTGNLSGSSQRHRPH